MTTYRAALELGLEDRVGHRLSWFVPTTWLRGKSARRTLHGASLHSDGGLSWEGSGRAAEEEDWKEGGRSASSS